MTAGPAPWAGALVGLTLLAAWAALLAVLLGLPTLPAWAWLPGMLAMTWLFTGLFITAHDAMHGIVWPGRRRLNDAIGATCTTLYAAMPWRPLLQAHRRHHRHAGTADDPDFSPDGSADPVRWYLSFVREYVTWKQVLIMAVVFNVLAHGMGVPQPRLLAFWVGPALLSTLQLFVFGTWLPHRPHADAPFADRHRARSQRWPTWLSLLTCYHFGYHWEHHAHPHVPWWRLPATVQNTMPPTPPVEV